MNGSLVIVSGSTASGKTTLRKIMQQRIPDIWFSVSCTTREMRPGEEDGKDYYFISDEEFREMIEKGEFLEYATHAGHLYGTPKKPVLEKIREGKIVYLEIEINGFRQIREKFPRHTSIFLTAPSLSEVLKRLEKRGQNTEEDIRKRIEKAHREMKVMKEYEFVVVNDILEKAADEMERIILASRNKMLNVEEFVEKWEKS